MSPSVRGGSELKKSSANLGLPKGVQLDQVFSNLGLGMEIEDRNNPFSLLELHQTLGDLKLAVAKRKLASFDRFQRSHQAWLEIGAGQANLPFNLARARLLSIRMSPVALTPTSRVSHSLVFAPSKPAAPVNLGEKRLQGERPVVAKLEDIHIAGEHHGRWGPVEQKLAGSSQRKVLGGPHGNLVQLHAHFDPFQVEAVESQVSRMAMRPSFRIAWTS